MNITGWRSVRFGGDAATLAAVVTAIVSGESLRVPIDRAAGAREEMEAIAQRLASSALSHGPVKKGPQVFGRIQYRPRKTQGRFVRMAPPLR